MDTIERDPARWPLHGTSMAIIHRAADINSCRLRSATSAAPFTFEYSSRRDPLSPCRRRRLVYENGAHSELVSVRRGDRASPRLPQEDLQQLEVPARDVSKKLLKAGIRNHVNEGNEKTRRTTRNGPSSRKLPSRTIRRRTCVSAPQQVADGMLS